MRILSLLSRQTASAAALVLAATMPGCTAGTQPASPADPAMQPTRPTSAAPPVTLRFRCRSAQFTLRLDGQTALLDTGSHTYRLQHKPSSFDRRYASDEATFIQDGNSAVLVVADGGPFVDCRVQ